ncbi:hypothetical protein [uncultured Methylobacterium sp.]|uniref:hypothetical protein n=1 Tax=uncultured Methylobacterium sp. TaxID=157278 RepID=UPI002598AACF|nr:hypothetical protein [uncultured Methylobacterium sp.]
MTEADIATLRSIAADHERLAARTRALLGDLEGAQPANNLMPLAEACRIWGVSKDAGLKRARRGLGVKVAGRWFVRREVLGS